MWQFQNFVKNEVTVDVSGMVKLPLGGLRLVGMSPLVYYISYGVGSALLVLRSDGSHRLAGRVTSTDPALFVLADLPLGIRRYILRKSDINIMRHFKAFETTLYFNTRDEMIKVKLDKVVYFEADSNYCHVVFINGAKATLLTSLVNIEALLTERFKGDEAVFIRIGKRYIVNRLYISQINIPRQRLILTDYQSPLVLEIAVSKDALKNLKQLYTNI